MAFAKKDEGVAVIQPGNYVSITVRIEGRTPLVMNAFSKKGLDKMMADMATSKAERKSKAARPPRDFDDDFHQAHHRATDGWIGLPAAGIRAGMIDACRTVNLVMTRAKMALWILADGFDAVSGQPLVKLIAPRPPERSVLPVRNDNGSVDLRIRPMWREWAANVRIEFDADMITAESVVNLLDRMGRQVGLLEGRNFSKDSVGIGWGEFSVVTSGAKEGAADSADIGPAKRLVTSTVKGSAA